MTREEKNEQIRKIRQARKLPKILTACPGLIPGPLTAQISGDSFVRRFIDLNFPRLKEVARAHSKRLLAQGFIEQGKIYEQPVIARLAGTAIDYRIRAYFRNDLHRTTVIEKGLSNLQALSQLRKYPLSSQSVQIVDSIDNVWKRTNRNKVAEKFIVAFENTLSAIRPERRLLNLEEEERLCRFCILFAYLDWIGRAPLQNSALEIMVSYGTPDIEKMLGYIDAQIVTDLVHVSSLFGKHQNKLLSEFRDAAAGGSFAGSQDVNGADFDLVVDGCLIDIKATRKLSVTATQLRQLIGYWLIDYDDALKIRSIALCFVRYGYIQSIDIEKELLPVDVSPSVLRSNFQKQIQEIRQQE